MDRITVGKKVVRARGRCPGLLATLVALAPLTLLQTSSAELRLEITVRETENQVEFSYPSQADRYYRLEGAEVLTGLHRPELLALGQPGLGRLALPIPSDARFFRLLEVPRASPLDTDSDGMDDVFELGHPEVLDPLNPADAYADPDGDGWPNLMEYERGTSPQEMAFVTLTTSPLPGETGVSPTRESILLFSAPLAPATVLTTERLHATVAGRPLLARVELSGDRRKATLFPLEPMPGGSRVRVTFDASDIRDVSGRLLDADGDGLPGGTAVWEFATSGGGLLPGTAIMGRVFASELAPGPAPGTFQDAPLAGVRISVDGLEETAWATTDPEGRFTLSPCPAGNFFVHVDGRTAVGSTWPGGAYYPLVGKQWTAVAGSRTNLAGGTGLIYLPRIAPGTLQPVSASTATRVTLPAAIVAAHPEFVDVSLTVPANSLFNDQGVRGGSVGLAPVAPDRLPEPLPPGLQFPLVITVQTDGPSNFDRPAPVRFPNLPDPVTGERLPPGAKSALWSFNHDTGRWELQGPMTVTADGQYVDSDPGVGVRQPGWHAPFPGSQSVPPCPPRDHQPDYLPPDLKILVPDAVLFFRDDSHVELSFANRPAMALSLSDVLCETTRNRPVHVAMKWDGGFANFLEGAGDQEFDLYPGGPEFKLLVQSKTLLDDAKSVAGDRLYSARMTLRISDPVTRELLRESAHNFYRFADAADDNHGDGIVSMPDTTRGVVRSRPFEVIGDHAPTLVLPGDSSFGVTERPTAFTFGPRIPSGHLSAAMEVRTAEGKRAGTLTIEGHAKLQKVFVDTGAFQDELTDLANRNPGFRLSPVEVGLLSTPAKRAEVVEGAVDTALGLLSALGDGLSLVGTPEPDAIVFGAFTTPPAAVKTTFGHSDLVDAYSYGGYLELLRHCASYSAAEQNYRLSRILNQVPAGHVEIFLKNYFENVSFNLASELIHTLGKTIAHEIGHSVGLPHTAGTSDQQVIHYLGDDPTTALADVMAQGEDPAGSRRFSLSANAFRVAVGEQWDEHAGQGAVDYFRKFVQAGGNFDSALGDRDANAAPAPTFGGPVAWLLTGPDRTFVNSPFDLGSLEADGPGQAVLSCGFVLRNVGDVPLTLEQVVLSSSAAGWATSPILPGTVVPPNLELPITISFDSAEPGPSMAELLIACDALAGPYRLQLRALGTSAGPALSVTLPNNNLGGVRPGDPPAVRPAAVVLHNPGGRPLRISALRFENTDQPSPFVFADLPNPPNLAQPLVLEPGGIRALGLRFKPSRPGIVRGDLVIDSDDLRQPTRQFAVMGTGLPTKPSDIRIGDQHILVTTPLTTNPPVRLRSSADGYWTTFLRAEALFEVRAFDSSTGLIATYGGQAAAPGLPTRIATPHFRASTASDTDGDGLPDDIEEILGTAPDRQDTDGDGLSDFHAVLNGLDPLAGQPGLPGPRAIAPTAGEAVDLDVHQDLVVVAEGASGLSTFRQNANETLVLLARMSTPGPARRVSLWNRWAAVDTDQAGLALVDLTNPAEPRLAHVVPLAGGCHDAVLAADGVVLASPRAESKLVVIDLVTGTLRDELELPQFYLVDLCRMGQRVYALTTQGLHALALEQGELRALGHLELPAYPGLLRLAAADGLLVATRSFGFDQLSLLNPDLPALIHNHEDWSLTWRQVLPVTTDLALVLADGPGAGGNPEVPGRGVNLVRFEPGGQPTFQRRFPTSVAPEAGVIRNGQLFLALGNDGLLALNYLPWDTQGVAPEVTLTTDVPGEGVLEQRGVGLRARVTDDVQVTSVEFFLNEERVAVDLEYPFECVLTAPAWNTAPDGLRLRARAVDAGGLAAWSAEVVVALLRDTNGPLLLEHSPVDGRTFGAASLREVRLRFDEPLDAASVKADTLQLVSLGPDDLPHTADDAQVAGAQPNYLPGALVARLEAPLSLPAGLYQVRVGLGLTDRSGNPLANPETWTFRVFHLDATLEPTFTLYGHIDRPGATDSYSFLVSAGQRLFFRLPEFDLWSQTAPEVGWWLLAPDGSAVYRGTLGYQTLGTVTFTDPGLYTFVFGGDTYSDTGEFQIVCTPVPEAQVFAIAIGEQVDLNAPASGAGWIEASGAHDLYTFSVVAGTSVNLRLTATSEGLTYNNWTLRDPTGTPVFSRYLGWGDPGRIALEQGGVYTLDVGSDTDPGTGTYGFSLEP